MKRLLAWIRRFMDGAPPVPPAPPPAPTEAELQAAARAQMLERQRLLREASAKSPGLKLPKKK